MNGERVELPAEQGLDPLEAPDPRHNDEDAAADGVKDRIRCGNAGKDGGLIGSREGGKGRRGEQSDEGDHEQSLDFLHDFFSLSIVRG